MGITTHAHPNWFGDLPNGWQSNKIKHLCIVKRGASPRPIDDPKYFDDDGTHGWVRIADVTASNRFLKKTEQRLSDLGRSLSVTIPYGDLIVTIAGTVGKPIIVNIPCCIHDGFVYFVDLKENPDFLYYIFLSGRPYQGLGKLGTQLNLNTDTIGDIVVPMPKREIQDSIVAFLDRETAEADALVAKYERLIELLEEKRVALITQAVTKGLDLNVPMKDSGFEWIGHVPTHWRVLPLRRIAESVETGGTPPETEFAPDGVPWYTPGDFNLEIDLSETERHVSYSTVSINTYPKGSVLLVGIGATLGKVGLPPGESSSNQQCNAIIPYDDVAPRFLAYALVACYDEMRSRASASTLPILNQSKTKGLELPIAPRAEQEAIATWIDYKMADISCLTEKTKYAISLVKEHRSALITAAVTGQIDVTTYRSKRQMVEAFAQ